MSNAKVFSSPTFSLAFCLCQTTDITFEAKVRSLPRPLLVGVLPSLNWPPEVESSGAMTNHVFARTFIHTYPLNQFRAAVRKSRLRRSRQSLLDDHRLVAAGPHSLGSPLAEIVSPALFESLRCELGATTVRDLALLRRKHLAELDSLEGMGISLLELGLAAWMAASGLSGAPLQTLQSLTWINACAVLFP